VKVKNKVIILVSICLVVLIGGLIADKILGKSYLIELGYDEVVEKVENKESFVILFSQTTCTHCISYKPKLEAVANEYEIEIYYIDIDLLSKKKRDDLGDRLNFDATPITMFLKNGEETSVATRIEGDASKEKIVSKLKSNGFID
jgi:predicted bacteriocin transport accessory protein